MVNMEVLGVHIEDMNSARVVIIASLIIVSCLLIFVAFSSRRVWLLLTSGMLATEGAVCIFIPRFCTQQIGFEHKLAVDSLHIHLLRTVGVLFWADAVTQFRLRNRDFDSTVFTTLVSSRMVVSILMLLAYIYRVTLYLDTVPRNTSDHWNYEEVKVYATCLALASLAVSCMIQLYRCPVWGGYPESSTRLNFHVRLDALSTLTTGLFVFGLPQVLIPLISTVRSPGLVHVFLYQLFSILCIGSSLTMARAPNFLRDNDKVTLLECRVVQCVGLLCLQIYAQNWFAVLTVFHIFFGIGGTATWGVNAALGVLETKRNPQLYSISKEN